MNKSMQTPKFGDFLLYDGTFVSAPADAKEVKGIYLYDGISLIDFSPKRKMYRKACHWCWEHGGELASVKTLYFIIFHFEEINRLRAGHRPRSAARRHACLVFLLPAKPRLHGSQLCRKPFDRNGSHSDRRMRAARRLRHRQHGLRFRRTS